MIYSVLTLAVLVSLPNSVPTPLQVALDKIDNASTAKILAVKELLKELEKKLPTKGDATVVIDRLISLLGDESETVRYWSALCLSKFGSQAKAAVEPLERALLETRRKYPFASKTSESSIKLALQSINSR